MYFLQGLEKRIGSNEHGFPSPIESIVDVRAYQVYRQVEQEFATLIASKVRVAA